MEFTIDERPLVDENPNTDQRFKNVKEMKIGNGRWKQDNEAIRMYDDSGNVAIYIGIDQ